MAVPRDTQPFSSFTFCFESLSDNNVLHPLTHRVAACTNIPMSLCSRWNDNMRPDLYDVL